MGNMCRIANIDSKDNVYAATSLSKKKGVYSALETFADTGKM
jgi:hypothetical protein